MMPKEDRPLRGGITHAEAQRLAIDHTRLDGNGNYATERAASTAPPIIGAIALPYEGALLAMKRGAVVGRAGKDWAVRLARGTAGAFFLRNWLSNPANWEAYAPTCDDQLAEDWIIV